MATFTKYISDSLEELRLVRWPTRQQAVRLSAIVVVFTILTSLFFGLVDFGLSKGLQFMLSL